MYSLENDKKELKRFYNMKEELSNCCQANVKVYGSVTKSYRCEACKESCDLEYNDFDKLNAEYGWLQWHKLWLRDEIKKADKRQHDIKKLLK